MMIITSLGVICLLPLLSLAHMEMSWPYPIDSNLDSAVAYSDKDYSYTNPLLTDGSNYPCKSYQTKTPYVSKATWTAGGTYNMTLYGSATHGGGSCQLSLSYDNGNTFKVIESMIGGCPLTTKYSFTIPSDAPSSTEALFAWTWFNQVGNREMYMNCARVTIEGSTSSSRRRSTKKRQTSFDSLPDVFVCNVGNGCTTIENEDVVFPSPGSNVIYGTDTYATVGGSGYSISGTAIATTHASSTTATSATTHGTTPSTTARTISVSTTSTARSSLTTSTVPRTSTPASTATSATFSKTTSSSAAASTTTLSGPCTVGTYACNSATTFSQCVEDADGSTSYTYFGSVASGMECVDGQFVRENSGTCSTNGAIVCGSTGYTFYMCDNGGLVDMGSVAAGTKCVDGNIVYDTASKVKC